MNTEYIGVPEKTGVFSVEKEIMPDMEVIQQHILIK